MKHVWIVHMRGEYGSSPLFGVFGTFKAADKAVRDAMDGAKYNRDEQTWYRDRDHEWYSVAKEVVQ